MKRYNLMNTNGVTDCVWSTHTAEEMKNKVLEILTESYKNCYYALAGISKYPGNHPLITAWIEVEEDGKVIQEVDLFKAWELK